NWKTHKTILSGDINSVGDANDNSYHVVLGADGAILDGFTITGGNSTGGGGGIFCAIVSVTVRNCAIVGNKAASYGGGMYNGRSNTTMVENCLFADNEAAFGGGLSNRARWTDSSLPTLINCTFSGNSASSYGGGVYNYYSDPTLTNCTFRGNSAATGGGMYNAASDAIVTNCIFWADTPGEIYNSGSTPTVTYSDVQGGCSGTGNIDEDPKFIDSNDLDGPDDVYITADDGLRLEPDSPCVDAADGDAALSTDMLGSERVDIADVNNTGAGNPNYGDMGACEVTGKVLNATRQLYYPTIQQALDAASASDTIKVYPGKYHEKIDFKGASCTLTSSEPNDPNAVIIDANDTNVGSYAVTFDSGEDGNSVLEGLTVRGAYHGVYCVNKVSPVIRNCTVEDNKSDGIFAWSSCSPQIVRCTLKDNGRAGLYCNSTSSPIVSDRTVIIDNNSYGVYCNGSASVTLANCVIAYNHDYGVRSSNAATTVTNCTIYGHPGSPYYGYGIWGPCGPIRNCILWSNKDDLADCGDAEYCCVEDEDSGLGNFKADPCFADFNDFRLDGNSVCIDTGEPWADYSKEPTPNGGRINLGAYGNTSDATITKDVDGDGISDAWQQYYWPDYDPCDPDPNYGPSGNPDEDDFSNWSEYLFGYEPDTDEPDEPMRIPHVTVSPSMFDPTQSQEVEVQYWLNMDADVAVSFTDTSTNEVVGLLEEAVVAGANDAEWDGRDSNSLIGERGFYNVKIDANDNDGNTASYGPVPVELYYVHDITNLTCNPYRILPLNNELSKITYDLTTDANMVVAVYDPEGALFTTLVDDELQTQGSPQLTWYGMNKDPNDPDSRYISKDGAYLVRVRFVGMRESEETTIGAYK
ncbi:MAG: right-handed parallel beta-helix repeat-containing protein, partial [Planctomycetota bacterium]